VSFFQNTRLHPDFSCAVRITHFLQSCTLPFLLPHAKVSGTILLTDDKRRNDAAGQALSVTSVKQAEPWSEFTKHHATQRPLLMLSPIGLMSFKPKDHASAWSSRDTESLTPSPPSSLYLRTQFGLSRDYAGNYKYRSTFLTA